MVELLAGGVDVSTQTREQLRPLWWVKKKLWPPPLSNLPIPVLDEQHKNSLWPSQRLKYMCALMSDDEMYICIYINKVSILYFYFCNNTLYTITDISSWVSGLTSFFFLLGLSSNGHITSFKDILIRSAFHKHN